MKLIKASEGTVYEAPNHYNMWGIRKLGEPEGVSNFVVSVSEFLPNGGCDMTDAPVDRVYIVLRGSVTVKSETNNIYTLEKEDMLYIPAGEKRDLMVNGKEAARVMVVVIK